MSYNPGRLCILKDVEDSYCQGASLVMVEKLLKLPPEESVAL